MGAGIRSSRLRPPADARTDRRSGGKETEIFVFGSRLDPGRFVVALTETEIVQGIGSDYELKYGLEPG